MVWAAQLLKTACAVAIVLIVSLQLTNVGVTFNTATQTINYACLLGDNNGQSLCTYAYVGKSIRGFRACSHAHTNALPEDSLSW